MDIDKLKLLIAQYRDKLLGDNISNYDIEAQDTIRAIEYKPEKEIELTTRLWNLITLYQSYEMGSRPAKLLRLKFENNDHYLDRCYLAKGMHSCQPRPQLHIKG